MQREIPLFDSERESKEEGGREQRERGDAEGESQLERVQVIHGCPSHNYEVGGKRKPRELLLFASGCRFAGLCAKDGELGGLWKIEKGVDNERRLELSLRVVHWVPSDILQEVFNKTLRCFSIILIRQTGTPAA